MVYCPPYYDNCQIRVTAFLNTNSIQTQHTSTQNQHPFKHRTQHSRNLDGNCRFQKAKMKNIEELKTLLELLVIFLTFAESPFTFAIALIVVGIYLIIHSLQPLN